MLSFIEKTLIAILFFCIGCYVTVSRLDKPMLKKTEKAFFSRIIEIFTEI